MDMKTIVICVVVFFAIVLVIAIFFFAQVKMSQGRAKRALKSGDLLVAHREFIKIVRWTFGRTPHLGKGTFKTAVQGLAEVYKRAGVRVDLKPILDWHQAVNALWENKSNINSANGLIEPAMQKEKELTGRFKNHMENLPKIPARK